MSENETKIALLEQSMKQNKDDHNEIKKCIGDLEKKIDKFVDSAPNKFASKRTEQLFYTFIGGLALYVGYKIIDLL